MTRRELFVAMLIAGVLARMISTGLAQASFRNYLGRAQSNPIQALPLPDEMHEEDRYNFALGNFRFAMAVGESFEYNDNINFAQSGILSDVVHSTSLDFESMWRISDLNTISLSSFMSYASGLSQSEASSNGILVSPDSELALTMFTGAVKIVLKDYFSHQEEPYALPEISNVAKYGRYANEGEIRANWHMSEKHSFEAGFSHYNLWIRSPIYGDQNRASETIYGRTGFQLSKTVELMLNTTWSQLTFASNERPDGSNLSIGSTIEWQIAEYANVIVEGGFQNLQFDGAYSPRRLPDWMKANLKPGSAQDSEGTRTFYLNAQFNHRPAESFRHQLLVSKTAEIGLLSNFYDLYRAEYRADWRVMANLDLGVGCLVEYFETSGNLNEKAHRVGAEMSAVYYFTNEKSLQLTYRYIDKHSNLVGADYRQNLIGLSLFYKF